MSNEKSCVPVCVLALVAGLALRGTVSGQTETSEFKNERATGVAVRHAFQEQVRPLLKRYCVRCHDADTMTSGVRVDHFDGTLPDRHLRLWQSIRKQIVERAMPPADEPQLTEDERRMLEDWIGTGLDVARTRNSERNGSVRRLTVAQYRSTLRDLLGLREDLTDALPPDTVSKDGFLNNEQSMLLSPLLLEAYFEIAGRALDCCLVNETMPPTIQSFRMELGRGVNPAPIPDTLILGALSHLLENDDFLVTQLQPEKPFRYEPLRMRTHYRFIEGYQGNDTVRGWREFDSIYHAVFACMRGSDGYPKGRAYEMIPEGLLLRPAIPSAEVFNVDSTYGPHANFKISLRELSDHGNFRITVEAARYLDGLLLDTDATPQALPADGAITVSFSGVDDGQDESVRISQAGIYQVDVYAKPASEFLSLRLGPRHFSGRLTQPAFLVVQLDQGPIRVSAALPGSNIDRLVLTPLDPDDALAVRFERFAARRPKLGVHLGLRRDCGSTLTRVGSPQVVSSTTLQRYVFEGAINNYPSPDVEKDNVNYLAGIREIAVRSEYTDGRDMPRLRIRSVEFEGPYYEIWPPETHRRIFFDSEYASDSEAYAREIIRRFATRAFRRPLRDAEAESLVAVWKRSYGNSGEFRESIKDALQVVLTSPQFLFLIERSETPKPEPLDDWELASKLSYFLWNTAPDTQLLQEAAAHTLREHLDAEVTRMIDDPRFGQFSEEFVSQWLNLAKLDVVEINRELYPDFTRDTKAELRREPVQYVRYLIERNLPVKHLVQSDMIVANEVVASYYGLGERTESGFQFVPIRHGNPHLGGILSQAGILAGLSDGRESNPVKRGAWFARKLIAQPPDDPPPNVPQLAEDTTHLPLRERLERHRNQPGCANCHSGIDPWGIPFQQFDAGGRFRMDAAIDASSTLPDGTHVVDHEALRAYLVQERLGEVAFSFLKHLATYATGRTLSYNELEFLRKRTRDLKSEGDRMQDLLRFVVSSDLFLLK